MSHKFHTLFEYVDGCSLLTCEYVYSALLFYVPLALTRLDFCGKKRIISEINASCTINFLYLFIFCPVPNNSMENEGNYVPHTYMLYRLDTIHNTHYR